MRESGRERESESGRDSERGGRDSRRDSEGEWEEEKDGLEGVQRVAGGSEEVGETVRVSGRERKTA